MVQIGELAPDGVPYRIVKADKGKPTYSGGNKGEHDALILTFEKVRGDAKGERFTKNYAFFKDESGRLSGPGVRYLRQAARAMGVKEIQDTDELAGQTFIHEVKERPSPTGGNPFLDFYPVGLWSPGPNGTKREEAGGAPAKPALQSFTRRAPPV